MFKITSFECDTTNSKRWTLNIEGAMPFPCNVDFSGDRANAHYGLINLTDTVVNSVSKFLTNYHVGKKKFKPWTQKPQEHKTLKRIELAKDLSMLKHSTNVFSRCRNFQDKVMNTMNSRSNILTKVLIPGVSRRDEITTSGHGMATIELLEHCGVRDRDKNKEVTNWKLGKVHEKKRLSLDRRRSFKNKLKTIPQSFSRNFLQAIIFQKAMSYVVVTSGQLHACFHMLQTTHDMFRQFFKRSMSVVK